MILYDYRCSNCESEMELMSRAEDTNPKFCYVCKEYTFKRVISPTKTINLEEGSGGFYRSGKS